MLAHIHIAEILRNFYLHKGVVGGGFGIIKGEEKKKSTHSYIYTHAHKYGGEV
jgi:hypothetical protein